MKGKPQEKSSRENRTAKEDMEESSNEESLVWFEMNDKTYGKNIRKSAEMLEKSFEMVKNGELSAQSLNETNGLLEKWAEFLETHQNYKTKVMNVFTSVAILIGSFLDSLRDSSVEKREEILRGLECLLGLWKASKERMFFPEAFHCLDSLVESFSEEKPVKNSQKALRRAYDVVLAFVNHFQRDPNFDLLFQRIELQKMIEFAKKSSNETIAEKRKVKPIPLSLFILKVKHVSWVVLRQIPFISF